MALTEMYTFDNFVTCGSNLFAFKACRAAAEEPGRLYDPLFIYGRSGLGKTHLLYAIFNHVRASGKGQSVRICTAESLIRSFIASDESSREPLWERDMMKLGCLLIDDVDIMLGRKQTQRVFVSIIHELVKNGCQLVLTSRVPPQEIGIIADDMYSNFERGLLADLQPLDELDSRLIITAKAEKLGLSLSEEEADMIFRQTNGEVRGIEGGITRLRAEKKLTEAAEKAARSAFGAG